MIRCICIRDAGRPETIPASRWVKLKEQYHITHVTYHPMQGVSGCSLYEKPLGEEFSPYEYFKLDRFAIREEDIEAFAQLAKDCNKLDEIDLSELMEEIEVQKA